ncbi:ammonia channel protein [candidate division WOR-1 bacterium RIFOXYA12_FULL_52_29]|uniref:Ammonium transporter n=1 Tax=candidate division WOR-1 bacterium RIFOXYC12_FULL_54_18 TaxID=1802584 RepID=A0A1F4TA37_UNCSA|nr:MAG: ammonia channel protein [candidate division WOR-1 bacterium RIFOXYA2_FULL_51_19]OGC18526.1 MAG: ammonia channel protein [candidate division WOR-1 bacterium RIFOXYA12_FULL_52_29]OGC27385.1 MAG: ammonia channel protein [candidate division WOR-1 bacterium RIFOXYB2_FULL_45_9]OGC28943.1 MAG: ammonia channel protein [candidate division WOR-1 bacterium RIFOXYC12_FULL_54_18]OGC31296.1 MAG: ammonia channel protein [candidate division WOR-1 bacterium RIFOXYB12_FULL_52_16]
MNAGDTAWVLISTALVILMTPAVGFFYGGMVRKKNILSTIMMCFAALMVISIQWVLFGYTLAFGPTQGGIIGGFDWLGLIGVGQAPNADYAATIPALAFMIFQAAFAIVTPSLIVGAFVERIKFSSFLVFSVIWATIVYDPVAHWIWGVGGWLRNLGALDFAGGTVVHVTAGFSALAIALVIGKRLGYGKDNMEPSNIPIVVLGAVLLWFGWFGFNGGSALAANGLAVSAFVVTNTAAAAAAVVWMLLSWLHRRPSVLGVATGAVVGLVAITPASGFVDPLSAIAIGGIAAVISYYMIVLRMKLRIDESLDAFACHGMGGAWGAVATGIFASKAINPAGADGLIFGNPGLVWTQFLTVAVTGAFAFGVTIVIAKIVDATMGLRVAGNEELVGLDISQHAETA